MSNSSSPSTYQWDHPNITWAILVSIGAGLSTGLGGALVFFPTLIQKVPQGTILGVSLAISSGVMLYVSFIEIFVKSLDSIINTGDFSEASAAAITTTCFFAGMGLCVLLELLVHWISARSGVKHEHICAAHMDVSADASHPSPEHEHAQTHKVHMHEHAHSHPHGDLQLRTSAECCDGDDDCANVHDHGFSAAPHPQSDAHNTQPMVQIEITDDTTHAVVPGKASEDAGREPSIEVQQISMAEGNLIGNPEESATLSRMGLMTALAIAIHNFPEGLATFLATVEDTSVGASLGVAIAIHNIPEGLCVAMPIYYATGSRAKALFWATMSGLTEVVGGIAGFAILQSVFTPLVYGIVFSMVGGMMVFIVCHELLPAAHRYMGNGNRTTACLIFGMIVMAISLVVFLV